jgi:hypothetical protein
VKNIPHIDPKPITKIEDMRSPNRPSYPFPLSHWTVTEDADMIWSLGAACPSFTLSSATRTSRLCPIFVLPVVLRSKRCLWAYRWQVWLETMVLVEG